MVGNGLAVGNSEAPPAFAFGGLEAREQVEEGDGRGSAGSWSVVKCKGV